MDEQNGKGRIAKALAAAQAEMGNPAFDSQNPHFRSKFASLAAVRNAVVPTLAAHGISMCQDLQTTEKGIACLTILTHESGEQMTFGPLVMPASKPDAQGFGSAATYARRYSLMAVAGVVGDEDDDANAASGKPVKAVQNDPRPDTAHVDPALIEPFISRFVDIRDADLDKAEIDAAIYAMHRELAPQHDLYVAVMDALAGRKLIGRADWKAAVKHHQARQQEAA